MAGEGLATGVAGDAAHRGGGGVTEHVSGDRGAGGEGRSGSVEDGAGAAGGQRGAVGGAPLHEPFDVATQTRMFDPGIAHIADAPAWTIEVDETRPGQPGAAAGTRHVDDVVLRREHPTQPRERATPDADAEGGDVRPSGRAPHRGAGGR